MAEPSIERRLVGGEWRTVEREEGDGGGLPDGGTTGEVLTKASGADQDVEWAPGGGSQPFHIERLAIAFDAAGLAVQSFPQVSADAETSSFVIAGNHAAVFPAGSGLTSTSDLNSGAYTVVSATFGGGNTTIVVEESVADEGATGDVINAANGSTGAGVELYVPSAGDTWCLSLSYVSVTDAWDGSSPTLWIYQEGATDYQNSLSFVSGVDLSAADNNASGDFPDSVTVPTQFLASGDDGALLNTEVPLRVVVDDGSGGAPGSLAGAGKVVLTIASTP